MNYKIIKNNFLRGLWSASMVKIAVKKGVITNDDFVSIMKEALDKGILTEAQYKAAIE